MGPHPLRQVEGLLIVSDHLLWNIVQGWLHERYYNLKTIAVVDGYPVYQVEPYYPNTCISYMLITDDKVQITSNRIEISNYMGLEEFTLTGPVKTIMAGLPTFFEDMEQYLNREPQAPNNYAPPDGGLQILPNGGPLFILHNSLLDVNKEPTGPIESEGIISVYPSMDPDTSFRLQDPPNYKTL